ncbi:3'(2'),5'-bisphosphate nucleotidase CysQ [Aestuariibaculum suncheonense]|uniref:3'(2'),5'-bisphosphate nucleotidase CysQ n=1 Tax=Aestuariibaculum suncheonense TaxID=1028745 RepID=A0A8J6QF83_9FLAO|nr:3'(2'),5'-bisphosphate nucleotidase CysQ [Aestuariibaculum suncheonense]MBD0834591.1 3'(2'),5'-bisphosphate nucleotidase CysQ [Aestuariibaculum suncheonense]
MNKLLLIAIEAAVAAGAEIMQVYSGDFEVQLKDDHSPLTVADERANTIINRYLEPTSIPIISEENKAVDYAERKGWTSCWMVDPLDGTKEFVKRNGEFTVNIALIEKGKPVLGVIYVPAIEMLYYAEVKAQKAYKCEVPNHRFSEAVLETSVAISPEWAIKLTLRIVASSSHQSPDTDIFIKELKQEGYAVELVSKGSSLKFCLMAEGAADIYPRFAPTMEWDTAAGHALCLAVGLEVSQVDQDKPLVYNKSNLLNPYFIVQ